MSVSVSNPCADPPCNRRMHRSPHALMALHASSLRVQPRLTGLVEFVHFAHATDYSSPPACLPSTSSVLSVAHAASSVESRTATLSGAMTCMPTFLCGASSRACRVQGISQPQNRRIQESATFRRVFMERAHRICARPHPNQSKLAGLLHAMWSSPCSVLKTRVCAKARKRTASTVPSWKRPAYRAHWPWRVRAMPNQ